MSYNNRNNHKNLRITNLYGSRRGLVKNWWYRLLYIFRNYHRYQHVDWESVERLVFVCKGNICRSVYAEAIAKSLGAESTSCGLDTTDGVSAYKDAIITAKIKGIDLSKHEARTIHSMVFNKGDLLIAMEPWHVEHIKRVLGSSYQYTLLGLWARPAQPYIHDPYGKSLAYFENCFNLIGNSVEAITGQLSKK